MYVSIIYILIYYLLTTSFHRSLKNEKVIYLIIRLQEFFLYFEYLALTRYVIFKYFLILSFSHS